MLAVSCQVTHYDVYVATDAAGTSRSSAWEPKATVHPVRLLEHIAVQRVDGVTRTVKEFC